MRSSFAREHGCCSRVRGGGHNIAGNAVCDGGLMIDLSLMRSVRVDPSPRRPASSRARRWRPRPRDPGLRPRDADRHQLDHRHRRPDARRRLRLDQPQVRPDHRQPALGRRRHRRRRAACAPSDDGEPGPLLGAARRRRQLRRRHLLRVPAAPGRAAGAVGAGRPSVRRGAEAPAASIRRLADERARRADLLGGDAQGAAAAVPARRVARQGGAGPRRLLRGDMAEGEKATRAAARARQADRRRRVGPHPFVGWQAAFDPLLTPGARNYWKTHDFADLSDGAIDAIAGRRVRSAARRRNARSSSRISAARWPASPRRRHGLVRIATRISS